MILFKVKAISNIKQNISDAVLDARNENMAEISEVQDRLSTTQNTIKNLKLQLEALQEHDSQLKWVYRVPYYF